MTAAERRASRSEVPLLSVRGLKVHFPLRSGFLKKPPEVVRAVDGINFEIGTGETFALVGESGCGKSTTGNAILGLVDATEGEVVLDGHDILGGEAKLGRPVCQDIQIIFQDPFSSLDPRQPVGESVAEPLMLQAGFGRDACKERVQELLKTVGLPSASADRYPDEFSGGQRQRIVIARAIALEPSLIICDEPTSALDVSIQSQILNLLCDLQERLGLSYLFISHDLLVVRHIADRIAVMYLGQIVEEGELEQIFTSPRHPYTEALLKAIPVPDPEQQHARERNLVPSDGPSAASPAGACPFVTRCPIAESQCHESAPPLDSREDGRKLACYLR